MNNVLTPLEGQGDRYELLTAAPEYAAGAFKARLSELGITQSMNRAGTITDNAYIESFFHSMKAEVYHGLRHHKDDDIRAVLKSCLPFYNSARLHLSLN